MSSYRDPLNPEAVHFPGRISTRVMFVVIIGMLSLLGIAVALIRAPIERKAVELAILTVAALVLVLLWPPEIVTNEGGIRQHRILRIGERFIPWSQVEEIRRTAEVFGIFGMRSGSLETTRFVVVGRNGSGRVVFTTLHSDAGRFVKEVERRSGLTVS